MIYYSPCVVVLILDNHRNIMGINVHSIITCNTLPALLGTIAGWLMSKVVRKDNALNFFEVLLYVFDPLSMLAFAY